MANALLGHEMGCTAGEPRGEETSRRGDSTARTIYSAALLHVWSSTETANVLPLSAVSIPEAYRLHL